MFPLNNFNFSINSNKEKLELGEEQVNALQNLEEFVSSTEDCITLSGFAGTGKTSILKEFIGYLDDEEDLTEEYESGDGYIGDANNLDE